MDAIIEISLTLRLKLVNPWGWGGRVLVLAIGEIADNLCDLCSVRLGECGLNHFNLLPHTAGFFGTDQVVFRPINEFMVQDTGENLVCEYLGIDAEKNPESD